MLPLSQLRAQMHLDQEMLLMVQSVGAALLPSWVAALRQSMKTPLFPHSPTCFTGLLWDPQPPGTISPIICPVAPTTPKSAHALQCQRVAQTGCHRVPGEEGQREWCHHQIKEQHNHKQTHIHNMYCGHGCICTMKENITF